MTCANMIEVCSITDTTKSIVLKFHMENPLYGEMEFCSNVYGHVTKMGVMPIFSKTLLLQSQKANNIGPWYVA